MTHTLHHETLHNCEFSIQNLFYQAIVALLKVLVDHGGRNATRDPFSGNWYRSQVAVRRAIDFLRISSGTAKFLVYSAFAHNKTITLLTVE